MRRASRAAASVGRRVLARTGRAYDDHRSRANLRHAYPWGDPMSDIAVRNLRKTYGPITAVADVSFDVAEGEVFGFLGPNGAGKSTTVAILTTLALPTAGRADVGGFDVVEHPAEVRRIAGVALQEIGLDPLMSARRLLRMQAGLFGFRRDQAKRRADELLEIVGLVDDADRKAGQFSGGMRRRLDLAMALVHEPRILFLDEPTTGLDPASRRDVWQEVRRLNRERGMTIFLTTQYLEEADALAERIAIIDDGEIVREGTPDALKESLGSESINVAFDSDDTARRAQGVVADLVDDTRLDRATLRLYTPKAAQRVARVATRLSEEGLEPSSLTVSRPTLDDVFLDATGKRFETEVEAGAASEPVREEVAA